MALVGWQATTRAPTAAIRAAAEAAAVPPSATRLPAWICRPRSRSFRQPTGMPRGLFDRGWMRPWQCVVGCKRLPLVCWRRTPFRPTLGVWCAPLFDCAGTMKTATARRREQNGGAAMLKQLDQGYSFLRICPQLPILVLRYRKRRKRASGAAQARRSKSKKRKKNGTEEKASKKRRRDT